MNLTVEQRRAADAALAFVGTPGDRRHFAIHGLAGVGKTVTLAALAAELPGARIVAPTGKAAAVLRARCGLEVQTIHSTIYDFRGLIDDAERAGVKRPVFTDKGYTGLRQRVVLLDECSMVGESLANDLLKTGAIVVACGDPGQLPPVRDRQFFATADVALTQVHRQALDSPIVRQAHAVRRGEPYAADGDGFATIATLADVDLAPFDAILCWKNATRRQLNAAARAARGISGPTLRAGEPVMCLRNNYAVGIFNGEIYALAEDRKPGDAVVLAGGTSVDLATIEGFDADYERDSLDDETTPFALAYAITAHKSQGSEWPRVLVVDEMPSRPERPSWLYTAITRARTHVTVARPRWLA